MLQRFLFDWKFFQFLLSLDEDLAEEARRGRCPFCHGPLHQAHYPRKPRGWGLGPDEDLDRRFSFCCYLCRRRRTPPSFRFLGRKVYVGAIMVLVSALLGDASARRRKRLRDLCGVDDRTLGRWRKWWAEVFAKSGVWQGVCAAMRLDGASTGALPLCLLHGFRRPSLTETLTVVLQHLLPLTGGGGGN